MYCQHCGKKLENDAKFCPSCGKRTNGSSQDNVENRCPNCGHQLSSIEATCPACGFEVRARESVNAAKEFIKGFEEISKQKEGILTGLADIVNGKRITQKAEQQAAYIRNFSVPYTKEAVHEFLLLAASNFHANVLTRNGAPDGMSQRNFDSQKAVEQAWKDKFVQVFEKAKVTLKNEDFRQIQEIYDRKMQEFAEKKKKEKKIILWTIIGVTAPILFLLLMQLFSNK